MSRMTEAIEDRIWAEADYIIEHNATIRQAAEQFHVSKSTISRDMSKQLKNISQLKYDEVRNVTLWNLEERSHRAGRATRMYWLRKKVKKHYEP